MGRGEAEALKRELEGPVAALTIYTMGRGSMVAYKVTFMFDGRLLKEVVSCTTIKAARQIIEARYPGARVVSVAT